MGHTSALPQEELIVEAKEALAVAECQLDYDAAIEKLDAAAEFVRQARAAAVERRRLFRRGLGLQKRKGLRSDIG